MTEAVLTSAGIAALLNAENTGTREITIDECAIGDGTEPLDASSAGVTNEVRRLTCDAGQLAGDAVAGNMLYAVIRDESREAAYTMTEYAYYLSDGTCFAVYSQSEPIVVKSAGSTVLQEFVTPVSGVDIGGVQFGSARFDNPPATTETEGIAELATLAEARAGTDSERITTPAGVRAVLRAWLKRDAPGDSYPINIGGTAANAAEFGGRSPAYYRTADNLTGTAPRGVLPLATATLAGAVRRASTNLAAMGTDDAQYVTPAGARAVLSRWLGRDDASGSYPIDIGGKASTAGNADTVGNETPAQLHNASNLTGTAPRGVLPLATATLAGVVRRASKELAAMGTDDAQYVTPAGARAVLSRWLGRDDASGSYPIDIGGKAASAGNADTVGDETPEQLHNAGNLTGTAPRDVLPLATATLAGVVRRASKELAAGGTDDAQYVTPAGARAVLSRWLGRDDASGSYPIDIGGKAASAGNADTVDGKHASDFAPTGGDPDEFWKVRTATADGNAVNNERLREAINQAKRELRPVGSIFLITGDGRNPREILGFGQWELWSEGKALVGAGTNGAGSTYRDGDTFGQETVELDPDQIPPVEVDVPRTTFAATYNGGAFRSDSGDQQGHLTLETKGGGQAHENRQPSQVQYAWRRTA